jgi:hypothetical protein
MLLLLLLLLLHRLPFPSPHAAAHMLRGMQHTMTPTCGQGAHSRCVVATALDHLPMSWHASNQAITVAAATAPDTYPVLALPPSLPSQHCNQTLFEFNARSMWGRSSGV